MSGHGECPDEGRRHTGGNSTNIPGQLKKLLIAGVVVGLIAVLAGGGIVGFDQWLKSDFSGRFVSTDSAEVMADLVKVGPLTAGRISSMEVDVGDPVLKGQVLAVLDMPSLISRSDITDTAKLGFRGVQDQRAEVVAPRSGVVASRTAKEGDTVPAGQTIVTLMDPRTLWIVANVEEGKIGRVQPGQEVEIELKSVERLLAGRVGTLSPVTAASLIAQQNGGNNARRTEQVVPVEILLDNFDPSLIPGSSASIKIRTP